MPINKRALESDVSKTLLNHYKTLFQENTQKLLKQNCGNKIMISMFMV